MIIGTPFYYTCYILRDGKRVLRQGTINAKDEMEAIDRIYDMGKVTWKRAVLEVVIMGNGTGEILASSTIGDRVGPKLLPDYSDEKFNDKARPGMAPWDDDKQWWAPTEFGSHFATLTFGRLKVN